MHFSHQSVQADPEKVSLFQKARQFRTSINRSSKATKKRLVGGVLVLVLGIGSISLAQRLIQPVGTPERSQAAASVPWTYPRKMKVLIMRYFNPDSQPDYKNPAYAKTLTDNMQGVLFQASKYHGGVNTPSSIQVEVVGTYDFSGQPPNNADWDVAYHEMLKTVLPGESKTACDKVNSESVDQIWFMGDPTIPGFIKGPEFAVSSKYIRPGALPLNYEYGILPRELFCGGQKSFTVLYFDLSRIQVGMHAFGHYMESLIGSVQGFDLFYKRFMGISYAGNGVDGEAIPDVRLPDSCGSVHVPPNVNTLVSTNPIWYKGYIYDSTNEEQSSCYNWKPDGTGQKTAVSASTWINNPLYVGGSDELKFHMWWSQNMPNIGNTLTYNNLQLPNWWDFFVDTDGTIAYYLNAPFFMNPDLWLAANSTTTASCASTTGTLVSCAGPSGGATLGVSDSIEGEVLQATTSYTNLALVTLMYGSSAQATKVTYCKEDMQKLVRSAGSANTEIWYKLNPKSGGCNAEATFNANPNQVVLTTTIFNNVDSASPFGGSQIYEFNGPYSNTSNRIDLPLSGPKDTFLFCVQEHYSEQTNPPSPNWTKPVGETREIWKYEDGKMNNLAIANVWAAIGVSTQRTSDNVSKTMSWTTVKTLPWSASCANVRVKPFTPVTVTPPAPPPPPPVTSVDLKVNGSNGPISIAYNKSVSLTWTSSNASSCTASNAWTGTKTTSGSFTTPLLTANKTYTITCTGSGGTQSDSVTVNVTKLPLVDLKINGSDTSVTFDKGIAPTLSWSQTGATSCTASGGWSGTKALAGGSEKGGVLGDSKSYTLTCINASGSVSDTVSVVATANTAPIGYLEKYYTDTSMQQLYGQRVTSRINYDWGTTGVPMPGMPGNYVSARYSAQITPSVTGTYTFITTSDDGARLYIDDTTVINNWAYHGRTVDFGYINLVAGRQYDLVLEFVESSGGSTIILQAGIGDGPAPINPVAAPLTLGSNGGGLTAEYFGTSTFTNLLATVREPVLETLWTTAPTSLLPYTYKSARYSGTIVPLVSATYTFSLSPDARMWVNNVEKVATAANDGLGSYLITHSMTAGTAYNIRFETPLSAFKYFYVRSKYGTQPLRPLDFKTLRPVPGSTPSQQPSPPTALPPTQSGLKGTYFDKRDLTGNSISRIDPYVQFYWSGAAPATSIPAKDFSALWTGTLVVPTAGSYTFYTEADDGMRVTVDGQRIIDKWTWESHYGAEKASSPMTLTAGDHSILVEYNQGSGGSKAVLRWTGPGITKRVIPQANYKSGDSIVSGVRASYFNNEFFTGTSIDKTDSAINFNWERLSPISGISVDRFSVRWTGLIMAPSAGAYTFYTEADDGIKVWIDGTLVTDYWWWQSHYGAEKASAPINLSAGTHTIKVEMHDGTGGAKAILRWSGPSITKGVLPIYLD